MKDLQRTLRNIQLFKFNNYDNYDTQNYFRHTHSGFKKLIVNGFEMYAQNLNPSTVLPTEFFTNSSEAMN